MKLTRTLAALFLLLLFLGSLGCGQKKSAEPSKGAPSTAAKTGDSLSKWDQLKQAAEKEGELVLLTTSGITNAALSSIGKEWEKSGFKIKLQSTSMAPAELGNKILSERTANMYTVDVGMIGQNTLTNVLKPKGVLDSIDDNVLILPDVKDTKKWYGDRLYYADKEKMILNTVFQIGTDAWVNTNSVDPKAIKTYKDLLKPEYKGKIVMGDIRMAGSPQQWLGAMMAQKVIDEDFLIKLRAQEVVISPEPNLVAQWVAQGKYPIGLAVRPTSIQALKAQGAPVAVALEGAGPYTGGGAGQLSLFNKAPHPNAAKLFINWFMTKETQTAVTPAMGYQSGRIDVPTTGLVLEAIRKEGVKYFNVGSEDFQTALKNEYKKVAERVFGAPGKEK